MGKTLRVCMAMGGGVSLGSFSGSALTEALKLLILNGQDADGNAYDKVIVDGMSGASAGAIALTIMLRCLIDYKSMVHLLGENATEDLLIEELAKDYFNNNKAKLLAHKNSSELIALQLAQKIQYKIWVDEVDSVSLYGSKVKKDYKQDPNKSFSLLDREHLETLAKKYLINAGEIDLNNKVLLDSKRVIFACSLTNLLPIQIDDLSKKSNKLQKNVLKSTGSDNHTELRVVDFVFDKTDSIKTDDRWLRFCPKPNAEDPTNFNITSEEAWATISASALACGAFPIAFEPVLLKRFQKEFGGTRKGTSWPKSFMEIQKEIQRFEDTHPEKTLNQNAFFGESDNNKLDYKSFNFPYIDGGTFNNEPIREAFKIGSFQDFGTDRINEERLVLFVDPIVRKEHYRSFKVESFSPVRNSKNTTLFKSEINKLTGNVSNILGVLLDQGSIKEEHKIIDTRENFLLRNTIFNYLDSNKNMSQNLTVEIINTAFNKVSQNLNKNVISIGTRDPIVYFLEQIRKSCRDQKKYNLYCMNIPHKKLYELKKGIDNGVITKIKGVYSLLELNKIEDQNAFAQAVFKVITDFSLNTDGKSEKNYKAAIMPVNTELNIIELPGGEIEAFGGFASLKARQYSFEFAKLSTLLSLKEKNGFRSIKNNEGKYEGKPFIAGKQLNGLKNTIYEKIDKVHFFDENSTYSKDLDTNLFSPSIQRIKGLLFKNKYISFLIMKVPFVASALFGGLGMSLYSAWSSLVKNFPWGASGLIKELVQKGIDEVNYIPLEPVTLSIVSDSKLSKNFYVKCIGENKPKKYKVLEHPFNSFGNKKRYQYFFKVSLAENIKDEKVLPDGVTTKLDSLKVDSGMVKEMFLTLSNKVKVPTNIDGNLNPTKKRLAIQKNYERIVESLRINNQDLPSVRAAINDPFSLLHYSFKNINFHVNPVIEIDMQQFEKGWYFKEQTESLDKKMLNGN